MSRLFLSTLDGALLLMTTQRSTPETPASLDPEVFGEIRDAYRAHFKITEDGVMCLGWERGETSYGMGDSMRTSFKIDLSLRMCGHYLLTHTTRSLLLVIVRQFG